MKNRINILGQQLGELQNKISRDRKKEKTDTKPRKMQSGGENSGKETPREISDTPRIPGNPGEKDSREATINIELGNSTDSATISEPVPGKSTRIQRPSKLTMEEFDGEMQEGKARKNNIVVRGFSSPRGVTKEKLKSTLRREIGAEVEIESLRFNKGEIVVELRSWKNKIVVMRRKHNL